MDRIKKTMASIVLSCLTMCLQAQGVFQGTTFVPQTSDVSILQNSLNKIEERNSRSDNQFSEAMIKYAESMTRKEYPLALAYIEECIRVNDYASSNGHKIADFHDLYAKKADVLKEQRKNAEAAELYIKAMQSCDDASKCLGFAKEANVLFPSESNMCYLAASYADAGYFNESLNLCNELIEKTTNNSVKCYLYKIEASIKVETMNLEDAIVIYDKIINLEPQNSENRDAYGWIMYKMGNYSKAIEAWDYILQNFSMDKYGKARYESNVWAAKFNIARRDNNKTGMETAKKELRKLSSLVPDVNVFLESTKSK